MLDVSTISVHGQWSFKEQWDPGPSGTISTHPLYNPRMGADLTIAYVCTDTGQADSPAFHCAIETGHATTTGFKKVPQDAPAAGFFWSQEETVKNTYFGVPTDSLGRV